MLGKIASAIIGEKIAERSGRGAKGALFGWAAPILARRAFGPLGLAVAGGYVAKKYYDRRKVRTSNPR
ncbi:hypothetical protein IC614_06115 [Allosphingosinicella flava]|uniref:Uncharacterized protein n=1 Tax=Allosphingosinicella flava TaxID=2771430 RepID=A0A7T2GLM6_9SPHN|nr:hypothetical protein [Sphingosinicella flava]QPQ56135.1 hypothetical protein IC614_06115 [Sphingosinicella flava]